MSRETRLQVVLALNVALIAVLVAFGFLAHSLGLLADAWDTVADVAAVLISLVAVRLTRRSPTAQRSFGYHRSTILAAQANAAAILAVTLLIVVEAVRRIGDPPGVHGGAVLVVAAVAVVVNGGAALVLAGDRHDLNMRAVLLDTLGDAAANAGVAAAGAAILITGGNEWLDPAVSLAVAAVIGVRALRLLAQAADVLLESTPAGLDVAELASAMADVDGVDEIHDLHVWSLSSEVRALSAHLVLTGHPTLEEAQVVGDRLRAAIGPRFAIAHATLELECESCIEDAGDGCVELPDLLTSLSPRSAPSEPKRLRR